MNKRYWVKTDFERFPVPYDHEPYRGERVAWRFGHQLKPDEAAAANAARGWWQLGFSA